MVAWSKLVGAALLVVITWEVNAATFDYGFVYDDHANIVERAPAWEEGWATFFTTRHWGAGRHAVLLSYDLDRSAPPAPGRFHVTNTVLAAAAAVLVHALALALGIGSLGAFAAGALFAVHPLHVDAVVAIAGRAELMAAIGVLGCLLLHMRGYRPRPFGLPLACVLFVVALASKESAACLLVLLILHDVVLAPDHRWRSLLPAYVAYGVTFAAWLLFSLANLQTLAPIAFVDNPLASLPAAERVARAAQVLGDYFELTVWPRDLRPDRSFAVTSTSLAIGIGATLAWLAGLAACWMWRARAPRAVFALAWFPVAFAATSNIAFPIGTIMSERLAYLPSVGPCLLVGLLVDRLSAPTRVRWLATASALTLVCTVLAFAYTARARVWSSDGHYHEMAAAESPTSAKAHLNLGLWRARASDPEGARRSFARALSIHPGFDRAAYHLAGVLVKGGHDDDAADVYRAYLRVAPADTGALSQLLAIEVRLADTARATATARRLVELEPDNQGYVAALTRLQRQRGDGVSP